VRALDRVNGMFAFAVWDDAERALTLAVDPFAEKPLLWARDGARLVFASDARALREALPRLGAPREDAIAPYLALGDMPPVDQSFLAGVSKLPPAHLMRVRGGREELRRYWTPQPVEIPDAYPDAVDELRGLLTDSIRLRLRSDVPVGTSLSGGVDSSAIVALSAELAGDHRRHAFTARFPGYARDEWSYAAAVASTAGVVRHHAIEPTFASLSADVERFVRDQEEPVLKLNQYAQWCVFEATRREGVTVLLDGQGADELFAGYDHTYGYALRTLGPRALARTLGRSRRARRALSEVLVHEHMPSPLVRRLRERGASPYVTSDVAAAATRRPASEPAWIRNGGPLGRELRRQAFVGGLPELLRYGDRNSMAHSREVRLPFLDRRVAEFALSLPASFLYRDGFTKAILRDAVRDIVPASVLDRRDKVGYEPPQAAWLGSEDGRRWAADVLLDRRARADGRYDLDAVEADVAAGAWRDPDALWRALNVELWLDEWARTPGATTSR
jgi:asparagine synthase (glutamine-hydrolysing)